MSRSTWTGADNNADWADPDNWSPAGVPGAGSDVVISTGAPVASASIGTVNSIMDSAELSFESAGTNTVTTFLDNTGFLYVDHSAGEGGTTLNIGTLTNSHRIWIGNPTLSAPDEVTAASLDNTGGIGLNGSSADQSLLDVTGAAGFGTAGTLTGNVLLGQNGLNDDSAIEFLSGQISTIAASSELTLSGSSAFIEDSTALGSNSALTDLTDIAGSLTLVNGASVSTTGALTNSGFLGLDNNYAQGGSTLSIGGALTNTGTLDIGNFVLQGSIPLRRNPSSTAGRSI